ncbi:MAG TPA: outer membrane lipoprotein-sorting protein [Vicinamibacterales bacterium]|nr:outer membrane lipoprotein-sorting protein [Vicinamibacterales bacterium]
MERPASRVFRPYARWIVAHRLVVVAAILLMTGFFVSRLGSLQVDSNPDLWAPQNHVYVETTNRLEELFGGRNLTVIGIVPKTGDIYQPKVLAKIKRIQDELELVPHAVRHNILSLAARKVKEVKGGPEGMEVRPMMETVPRTAEEVARLKAAVASMPIYINALVSPDGKAATVVADFTQDERSPNFIALNEAMHRIVDRERDADVDIRLGGITIIGEAADVQFLKMPIFFGAALVIILLVQYWSFRSLQGMLLPMLTGILSVLWSLGLMGLLGVHLDPLNTTTPILVLAVAAGHAIQILKRYYEEYGRLRASGLAAREANREAVIESMVRVGPVMMVAGLIAVITFLSLAGTGIPMVQHFGVFAGCGVLATMIIEMTVIPAVRSMLRPPEEAEAARERKAGVLDRFLTGIADNLVGGRAPAIVAAGLLVLAAVGFGATRLRIDNNFKLYFAADSQVRVDDRILNDTFGGTNSIQFLVQTPEADGIKDPRVLKGMERLQAFLESQPDVGKTQSMVDLIKRMNQAMHADDAAHYAVPESQDLVAQYLFLYSLSGDPQDFDSLVDNDYRRASVWAFVKNDSTTNADLIAKRARAVIEESFPPGVTVEMGGSLPQLIALNDVIVSDKFRNMAQMTVVVFVLGALVLRSLVGGLFVVTPLFAVMLANFGLMGWLQTPLDISAMTTAAMAIGIGADYEIYLLFRFREELARTGSVLEATRTSMLTSGKAILLVAISIIAGYAVLQASEFAFYNTLSNMVTATMVISAFFALFFLRALMMLFKPRFVFGDRREVLFKQVTAATVAAIAVGLTGTVNAAEPSARDIMEKNFFVTKVSALQLESTMLLVNDKGQQRERRSTGLIKLQPNGIDSKLVVRFSTPADIKGTSFLQVEHLDGDDDLWIYLPALKKSRRLVANNKKDSFVGSDFSYGDISLPKVDQYRHALLRNEKVDGFDCHVVESVPATDTVRTNSGYSKKITWVRADNFVETKVEYYDLAGRLWKTQKVSRHELVEPQKARWFALQREMTNHQNGHRTMISMGKVTPGIAVPDETFTTRFIESD